MTQKSTCSSNHIMMIPILKFHINNLPYISCSDTFNWRHFYNSTIFLWTIPNSHHFPTFSPLLPKLTCTKINYTLLFCSYTKTWHIRHHLALHIFLLIVTPMGTTFLSKSSKRHSQVFSILRVKYLLGIHIDHTPNHIPCFPSFAICSHWKQCISRPIICKTMQIVTHTIALGNVGNSVYTLGTSWDRSTN